MDKNSAAFTVGFASAVCVVLAVVLAGTFGGLRDAIAVNVQFDKQKNVLKAVGLFDPDEPKPDEELKKLFETRVQGVVLEVKRGMVTRRVKEAGVEKDVEVEEVIDLVPTDYDPADLARLEREERKKIDASTRREFAPLYTRVSASGDPEAYCIPISGYGLWSTLYGYLALEADLDQVKGITFYKHGETPGLGGEIENRTWQKQWVGKRILDNGALCSVTVKKGVVNPDLPIEKAHMVDGLSGATITSNGVTRFVKADLKRYEPYFAKLR